MKTNFQKSLLTVSAILIYSIALSQFTRNQAIDLVMNDILGADTSQVDVYASFDLKSQPAEVVLADNQTLSCPYADNWVFFIDDERYSFWYHPCRYIFVNSQDGNFSIINRRLFPIDMETA